MGDPSIFPKWVTKIYHPSDPKDPDYGNKKAMTKFFEHATTMKNREIIMAYFWSYHTPIKASSRVIFIEPPDCVIVSVLNGDCTDYALPPMSTFRDAEVEKAWGHILDDYLARLYPKNIVSQPEKADEVLAIPALPFSLPARTIPPVLEPGGWGRKPPAQKRSADAPDFRSGQRS